ncbi:hypothetical protein LshimejAT787_1105440 [Lyophyllum shimeji]|uniref:Uncharacterized protein n=1 Tax=Lyophyllum shimeji TaxID=47721 RepID=A0A9P3PVW5_LYOSH|nr:hypothetical protein LshimejAT787_1105440 [Lyophyllum shimeji]
MYYAWSLRRSDADFHDATRQSAARIKELAIKEGQNVADASLYPSLAIAALYGPENVARLKALRERADPGNVMGLAGGSKISALPTCSHHLAQGGPRLAFDAIFIYLHCHHRASRIMWQMPLMPPGSNPAFSLDPGPRSASYHYTLLHQSGKPTAHYSADATGASGPQVLCFYDSGGSVFSTVISGGGPQPTSGLDSIVPVPIYLRSGGKSRRPKQRSDLAIRAPSAAMQRGMQKPRSYRIKNGCGKPYAVYVEGTVARTHLTGNALVAGSGGTSGVPRFCGFSPDATGLSGPQITCFYNNSGSLTAYSGTPCPPTAPLVTCQWQ